MGPASLHSIKIFLGDEYVILLMLFSYLKKKNREKFIEVIISTDPPDVINRTAVLKHFSDYILIH